MIDAEDIRKRESALSTFLSMMKAPEFRKDVSKDSNLRWLIRNLQIQNRDHPMLKTAKDLAKWLLKERKNGNFDTRDTQRNN